MSEAALTTRRGRDEYPKRRLRLWLRMLRTTRQVEARLRDYLREEHGTTLPRFDVLAILDREGRDMKMSELSRRLLVSNGNVTGIVERLVLDGLVDRVPRDDDRRAMRVRLTDKGREAFKKMAAGHEAVLDSLFRDLDHDALDALRSEFAKLKPLRKVDDETG
ncbi:MAG: MarR family transcriptional regulator [Pseudomonadota bacterium]